MLHQNVCLISGIAAQAGVTCGSPGEARIAGEVACGQPGEASTAGEVELTLLFIFFTLSALYVLKAQALPFAYLWLPGYETEFIF